MESTGCYHLNLFSFLTTQGIVVVVINPLLIANFAKRSLRRTKMDKKDARVIAKFLMENRGLVFRLLWRLYYGQVQLIE
jgi:transposase